MESIDLTFGIPVYNAEEYIKELLDCFKETNKFTYEVIIVDDGSKDNSYNICKKYKNKYFKVYHEENKGVSSARNFIIDKSKGEWITFIDADDLIDFNKYEKLFVKIKEEDYDYHIGIRKQKHFNYNKHKLYYLIEHELINSPIDKFYKMEIINKNCLRFNSKYSLGEDLLFNLYYLKNIEKINYYYSDGMYVIRTINDNSLTHKFRNNKYNELMNVNKECMDIFSNDIIVKKSLEYIRIKNCISCIKDISIFPNKFKDKISYIKQIKKEQKFKYFYLNNFKTTIIYYFFHLCPYFLLDKIINILFDKLRKKEKEEC